MLNKRVLIIVSIIFFICLTVFVIYGFLRKQEICLEKYEHHSVQNIERKFNFHDDISDLKITYSSTHILLALSFILRDEFSKLLKETYSFDYSDYITYENQIKSIITKQPTITDSLLFVVQNMEKNEIVIKQIRHWCEAYVIISIGYELEELVSYEELLFDIPAIHNITSSFIDNNIQDWHSLSISQIYQLPYEICNYLSKLSDNDRMFFYESLFNNISNSIK